MNYVRGSCTQRLNHHAAHLILRNGRDPCTATYERQFIGIDSRSSCRCAQCSLTRCVSRGLKLTRTKEKERYEILKPVSTQPLFWLKAFAVGTLKSTFTLIFFIVTISLPITLIKPPAVRTEAQMEPATMNEVTEGQNQSPNTETQVQLKEYPNSEITKNQIYSPVTDTQIPVESDLNASVTEEQILRAVAKPPQQIVTVSEITPTNIDFGTVLANTSTNLTITVKNLGGSTLTGSASVAAPFQIVSGGAYSLGNFGLGYFSLEFKDIQFIHGINPLPFFKF